MIETERKYNGIRVKNTQNQLESDEERQARYNKIYKRSPTPNVYAINTAAQSLTPTYIPTDDNSRFDEDFTYSGFTPATSQDVLDARAENQPWISKFGSGLGKFGVAAVTTAARTSLGLLDGIVESATGTGNLHDNYFINNIIEPIENWAEENLPNYQSSTDKERNFFRNTLGDIDWWAGLMQSVGFMVGDVAVGSLTGGLTTKLITSLGAEAGVARFASGIAGSVMASFGEAGQEASQNKNTVLQEQRQLIDKGYQEDIIKAREIYQPGTQEFYNAVQAAEAKRNKALQQAEQNAQESSDATFKLNIPVIMAENVLLFGKLFSRGFNKTMQDMAKNSLRQLRGDIGSYQAMNTADKITRGIKYAANPLYEGAQEMTQNAIQEGTKVYYGNSFYEDKNDPEARSAVNSFMKSAVYAASKTVNSQEAWGEGLAGALMGMFGAPVRLPYDFRNKSFQNPMSGGTINDFLENRKEDKTYNELAQKLNERTAEFNGSAPTSASDGEMADMYRKLVTNYDDLTRHLKYEQDKENDIVNDDTFNYHTDDFKQLFTDIHMFDKAGRLQDLKDLVSTVLDTSDESKITDIINSTSARNAEGKLEGNFIENGNPISTEQAKEIIDKQKNEFLSAIDSYESYNKYIDIATKGKLSDDDRSELAYMKMAADNFSTRKDALVSSLTSSLDTLRSKIAEKTSAPEEQRNEDLKLIDDAKSELGALDYLLTPNENVLGVLRSNTVKKICDLSNKFLSNQDPLDTAEILKSLNDIVLLNNAMVHYENRFQECLKNPKALEEEKKNGEQEHKDQDLDKVKKEFNDIVEKQKTATGVDLLVLEYQKSDLLKKAKELDSNVDITSDDFSVKDPTTKRKIDILKTVNEHYSYTVSTKVTEDLRDQLQGIIENNPELEQSLRDLSGEINGAIINSIFAGLNITSDPNQSINLERAILDSSDLIKQQLTEALDSRRDDKNTIAILEAQGKERLIAANKTINFDNLVNDLAETVWLSLKSELPKHPSDRSDTNTSTSNNNEQSNSDIIKVESIPEDTNDPDDVSLHVEKSKTKELSEQEDNTIEFNPILKSPENDVSISEELASKEQQDLSTSLAQQNEDNNVIDNLSEQVITANVPERLFTDDSISDSANTNFACKFIDYDYLRSITASDIIEYHIYISTDNEAVGNTHNFKGHTYFIAAYDKDYNESDTDEIKNKHIHIIGAYHVNDKDTDKTKFIDDTTYDSYVFSNASAKSISLNGVNFNLCDAINVEVEKFLPGRVNFKYDSIQNTDPRKFYQSKQARNLSTLSSTTNGTDTILSFRVCNTGVEKNSSYVQSELNTPAEKATVKNDINTVASVLVSTNTGSYLRIPVHFNTFGELFGQLDGISNSKVVRDALSAIIDSDTNESLYSALNNFYEAYLKYNENVFGITYRSDTEEGKQQILEERKQHIKEQKKILNEAYAKVTKFLVPSAAYNEEVKTGNNSEYKVGRLFGSLLAYRNNMPYITGMYSISKDKYVNQHSYLLGNMHRNGDKIDYMVNKNTLSFTKFLNCLLGNELSCLYGFYPKLTSSIFTSYNEAVQKANTSNNVGQEGIKSVIMVNGLRSFFSKRLQSDFTMLNPGIQIKCTTVTPSETVRQDISEREEENPEEPILNFDNTEENTNAEIGEEKQNNEAQPQEKLDTSNPDDFTKRFDKPITIDLPGAQIDDDQISDNFISAEHLAFYLLVDDLGTKEFKETGTYSVTYLDLADKITANPPDLQYFRDNSEKYPLTEEYKNKAIELINKKRKSMTEAKASYDTDISGVNDTFEIKTSDNVSRDNHFTMDIEIPTSIADTNGTLKIHIVYKNSTFMFSGSECSVLYGDTTNYSESIKDNYNRTLDYMASLVAQNLQSSLVENNQLFDINSIKKVIKDVISSEVYHKNCSGV